MVSEIAGAEPAVEVSRLTFDEALLELQRTVSELEQGGLPLERSIACLLYTSDAAEE